MGIGEQHAAAGEPVEIRGVNALSAAHAVDPVIQVIYCDEQYVRLRRSLSLPSPQEYETQDGLDNETSLHTA